MLKSASLSNFNLASLSFLDRKLQHNTCQSYKNKGFVGYINSPVFDKYFLYVVIALARIVQLKRIKTLNRNNGHCLYRVY